MKKLNFGINGSLWLTANNDPNLSRGAKNLFALLVEEPETSYAHMEHVAELIQRNYVWIEGFPASVPVPGSNRTAWAIRLAALKSLFTGRPA